MSAWFKLNDYAFVPGSVVRFAAAADLQLDMIAIKDAMETAQFPSEACGVLYRAPPFGE